MKKAFDQRVTSGIIIFCLLILSALVVHSQESLPPIEGSPAKPEVAPGPESASAPAPAKVLDKEMDYVVKNGDTLWDISKRFYGDAFLWPRLWQQNQYITNPHHISPGDRIRLYPYKVLIEEEAKPPVAEETKPLPPPKIEEAAPPLTDKMEGIGTIVGAEIERLHYAAENEVYISFKKGISVKKGDQFTIFRTGDPIPHPAIRKKVIGRKVLIVGTAVIIKTTDGGAQTALITRCDDYIISGDEVVPYFAPAQELEVSTMEEPLYGWIVASRRDKIELVLGDVIYIDRGEEDHVRPGLIFRVIRRGAVVPDTASKEKKAMVKLPDEFIARAVVLKTQQKTSTALIVQTRQTARVGDEITTVAE